MPLRRYAGIALGAAALILASPLIAPQVLAFPHYAEIEGNRVWSETPIDRADLARVMERADRLVAASPIARDSETRDIFFTRNGWRWVWLANQSRGAFALTRLAGQKLIINRADFDADRVVRGPGIGGSRQLSSVIAHEKTHGVLLNHFGFVAMALQPRWKVEGYCDHVAQESALSPSDVKDLEESGQTHPALMYYRGRKRVEQELESNGGDVTALFSAEDF